MSVIEDSHTDQVLAYEACVQGLEEMNKDVACWKTI